MLQLMKFIQCLYDSKHIDMLSTNVFFGYVVKILYYIKWTWSLVLHYLHVTWQEVMGWGVEGYIETMVLWVERLSRNAQIWTLKNQRNNSRNRGEGVKHNLYQSTVQYFISPLVVSVTLWPGGCFNTRGTTNHGGPWTSSGSHKFYITALHQWVRTDGAYQMRWKMPLTINHYVDEKKGVLSTLMIVKDLVFNSLLWGLNQGKELDFSECFQILCSALNPRTCQKSDPDGPKPSCVSLRSDLSAERFVDFHNTTR